MQTAEMGVSLTLKQFWLKVKFWVSSQDWGCSAPALQVLLDEGLVSLTAQIAAGDGSSLELWFRTMVHDAWQRYLRREEQPEALHDLMARFAADAERFAGVLRSICDCDSKESAAARVLRSVCEDGEALATLAWAWKPDQVLAGAVQSALAHVKTKRMEKFDHLLPKSAIGREMLLKGAAVMATAGQETAADAKFQQAQKLLQSDTFPRIEKVMDSHVVSNRDAVADLRVYDLLGESLSLIAEAIHLWSRATRSRRCEEVVEALDLVYKHLALVDGCSALDMELVLADSGVVELILDDAPNAAWDAAAVAPHFATLRADLSGVSLEGQHMAEFLDRMIKMLRRLPVDILDSAHAEVMINEQLEPLRASEAGRCQLVQVLRLMSAVLSVPDTTAATLYEEVKRCAADGNIDTSRLSQVVQLQEELLQLQDAELADPGWEGYHYQPEQCDDEGDTLLPQLCPCTAQKLVQAVPGWFALGSLQTEVEECLNLLLADIVKGACLPGLRTPRGDSPAELRPPQMLEACIACTAGNAKSVDAVLKSSSYDGVWPGDSLVDLACAILQMYADRKLPVGVSAMCIPDAEPEVVEDLEALERVLRLFQVVGKVGRLFAWARCNFSQLAPASW